MRCAHNGLPRTALCAAGLRSAGCGSPACLGDTGLSNEERIHNLDPFEAPAVLKVFALRCG